MNNYSITRLKRPAKYGKITLILRHIKGAYHMFTGLKKQLEISDILIENILPLDNELVKLRKILNWEKINEVYSSCYRSQRGNKTKTTDIALGLILLKHLYKKTDRALVAELHLNNAYMHFCNVSYDEMVKVNRSAKKLIDHFTLVKIRKRLGPEKIEKILALFTQELILKNIIDGKVLFTDTTSMEKNIIYPTDVGLLSRLIKEAECVIQNVTHKKMVIKSVALKKAKAVSRIYYSSAKKSKELLSSTTSSLLKIAKEQLIDAKNTTSSLTGLNMRRYQDLKEIGSKIIAQTAARLEGLKIGSRILSYHEPHTRALPKGKIGKPCEFGSKLALSMAANGYISSHTLYSENVADISTLENVISDHKSKFGHYFEAAAADRAYYDEELMASLERKHNIALSIPHKKRRDRLLEDSRQDLYDKRAAIEAKISEAKRMYGLSKSYYSGFDGDRMWAALAIMATNMRKLLRDIDRNPKLMLKFE